MTQQAVSDFEIEQYRRISGEERLAIALHLHERSCDMVREAIRVQHHGIENSEVEKLFRRRIASARNFGGDSAVEQLFNDVIKARHG
jgi:hypothetical protein